MKKLVTLLLALAMLLSVMCIPAAVADDVTTVVFWTHQNTAWNESWKGTIERFEAANPDIHIEYEQFPYADMATKTQTSLMSDEAGADVYEIWGAWALDFVEAGALAEVPEYLLTDIEDCYAPCLGTIEKDGKYYGAPLELNSEYGGMIVNKALFEEAGAEYPTTWTEMMDLCKQVVVVNEDGTNEMRGLQFIGSDTLFFNWIAYILQSGGELFDEEGRINFNSEVAVNCMKDMVSWVTEDHITDLYATYNYDNEAGGVCLDECFMCTKGSWAIEDCEASYEMYYPDDIDYVHTPAFVEGVDQLWAAETGWSLCVNAKTEVYDAAWKFVAFVMEPEELRTHNIECGQIPARKSVMNDPAYIEAVPYMEAMLPVMDYATYVGKFNTDDVKTYVKNMFVSLVENDGTYASVEEGCATIQQMIIDNIKFY